MGHTYVGSEHILLGLLRVGGGLRLKEHPFLLHSGRTGGLAL